MELSCSRVSKKTDRTALGYSILNFTVALIDSTNWPYVRTYESWAMGAYLLSLSADSLGAQRTNHKFFTHVLMLGWSLSGYK